MQKKSGKFFADWRDCTGKRHRRAFAKERDALDFQRQQQEFARSRRQARASDQRCYAIPDWRLEKPEFKIEQVREGDEVRYIVHGDLSREAPPIRESKYLSRQQHIEIYRLMLLNRRMETALENLYKQGKVVGGVYFGLGQEACSCASCYALKKDEWMGPMIRNQGSLLVKGFPRATS